MAFSQKFDGWISRPRSTLNSAKFRNNRRQIDVGEEAVVRWFFFITTTKNKNKKWTISRHGGGGGSERFDRGAKMSASKAFLPLGMPRVLAWHQKQREIVSGLKIRWLRQRRRERMQQWEEENLRETAERCVQVSFLDFNGQNCLNWILISILIPIFI